MPGYLKIAFLLIALSLTACATGPTGPTHDQTLNQQGFDAMQAGNLPEAEHLMIQAIKENPNNLQALYNLGTIYQMTNRPDQAREYYQRVIDGQPNAAKLGQDPEQAAKLAQAARNNLAQIDREEAIHQEAARQTAAQQAATETASAQPAQMQPAQMQPTQMQPSQMQPTPMQPAPMQPAPMQPAPMQPAPMQPAQMQPAQMQPALVQPAPTPVVGEAGYRVQTGAFVVAANAESMRDQLMGRYANLITGKRVRLVKVSGMTKVQVGPYRTSDDADKACRAFQRAGVSCFRIK